MANNRLDALKIAAAGNLGNNMATAPAYNRTAGLLGRMLAPNLGVNLPPEMNPGINAPTLSDRLQTSGYQSFMPQAQMPGADLGVQLQNYPQMPIDNTPDIAPTYGANSVLGQGGSMLGNLDVGVPAPMPQAEAQPQQQAQPQQSWWQDPEVQANIRGLAGMFSDIGARPGVSPVESFNRNYQQAIKNAEASRNTQLMNKLREQLAKNPNMTADELANAIAPIDPVKAAQLKIAAQKNNAYQSPYGKALHDVQMARQIYGENSPEYAQAVTNANNVAQGKGMQLVFGDDGKLISFTQGSGGMGNKNVITTRGMVQDTGTAPGRGGAGATYTDPDTGRQISTLTPSNVTKVQAAIQGAENAKEKLDAIIKNLPQFQSGWRQLQKDIEVYMNKWGPINFSLPDEFAKGQAALLNAPEQLLRAYGLNQSDEAMARMEAVIKPIEGETADGYRQRVMDELKSIEMRQRRGQSQLSGGIPLNSPVTPASVSQPSVVPQFIEGKVYVDSKTGVRKRYVQGRWENP